MRALLILISLLLVGCNYAPQESTMESCIEQLEEYYGEEKREYYKERYDPEDVEYQVKDDFVRMCVMYGKDEE